MTTLLIYTVFGLLYAGGLAAFGMIAWETGRGCIDTFSGR